jgi:outer membrane protein assembly factor BamB
MFVRQRSRLTGRVLVALLLAFPFAATSTQLGAASPRAAQEPGDELWVSRFNSQTDGYDAANGLAISPDGATLFVTGEIARPGSESDYGTVAYDAATGDALWTRRYDSGDGGKDIGAHIAVAPQGDKVFVTGFAQVVDGDQVTVAYDATGGAQLWVGVFDSGSTDYASDIAVSPDGSRVFVTGGTFGGHGTGEDYATVAFDAQTGDRLWARRYAGPKPNGFDIPASVGVSPDGGMVFVTGFSASARTGADYATLAYDAVTGNRVWLHRFNDPNNGADVARDLGVSPDGTTLFVTGQSESKATTVAIDAATGERLWVSRNQEGFDAFSLGVSPDGARVFVTGQSSPFDLSSDYATVAYNAGSGAQLWASSYAGPSDDDKATLLVVSPDGTKVIVTGESDGSPDSDDYATVAYDATTGGQLWVGRYNGPGNSDDRAHDLAISPDGTTVFMTGESRGSGTDFDFATIAYRS